MFAFLWVPLRAALPLKYIFTLLCMDVYNVAICALFLLFVGEVKKKSKATQRKRRGSLSHPRGSFIGVSIVASDPWFSDPLLVLWVAIPRRVSFRHHGPVANVVSVCSNHFCGHLHRWLSLPVACSQSCGSVIETSSSLGFGSQTGLFFSFSFYVSESNLNFFFFFHPLTNSPRFPSTFFSSCHCS
jgi:hypothetical protein